MKVIKHLPVIGVALLVVSFQNCAAPEDAQSGRVASLSSSSTSSLTSSSTLSSTSLIQVSFSPVAPNTSSQIIISASGGALPYSFILVHGAGKLTSNVYIPTSAAETVTILVRDQAGQNSSISFPVISLSTSASASPTPASATAPVPTPIPVTGPAQVVFPSGKTVVRTCSLQQIAITEQTVAGVVDYAYCLVYMRLPTAAEAGPYIKNISNGNNSPLVTVELIFSTYANANLSKISDNDYVTTTSRILLFHDPAGPVNLGSPAIGRSLYFEDIIYSPEFFAIHPGLKKANDQFCAAGGDDILCY